MKRRVFLKSTMATGVLVASGAPLLSSCSGVKRADLPEGEETPKGMEGEDARILWYASLAPSGHNSQPWVVKVLGKGEWIIGAEPQRRLPAVDPDNRELLLSIGAFAENLALAASVAGYEAALEVIAKGPRDEEVLHVSLKKATPGTYPLERLTLRRTVKNGFLSKEIAGDDVKALAEPHKGQLFYYPRGTDHARCIQEGTVESYRAQTYREEAQKELAQWIRFSNSDARKHRDGLTTEGMEITGFAGWFVRQFMDQGDVMGERFRKQGLEVATKWATEGAGWMIITSGGTGVADLIETGRRFERTALLARERNIALHPMTQVLEEERGRREITSNHGKEVIPQFVLRVGYLDTYPAPVSLRRTVASFVRA
ncbi:MAG: nitroreductase [Desulfobacterota bacterium]|nr:nitroreductase [Thermodesulfobacteriota bacterium]